MGKLLNIIFILFLILSFSTVAYAKQTIVKGKVTDVTGNIITIDRGREHGLAKDMKGEVYYEIVRANEVIPIFIAAFKLNEVGNSESKAEIDPNSKREMFRKIIWFKSSLIRLITLR